MSLPWATLFGYLMLIVAAIAILWGLSVLIERHATPLKRDRNIIDHHYVAALESMVAQAEAETETLRAELQRLRAAAASEYDANAALFGRVGLSPAAPEWLVAAARRAYRAALHPDRHPTHRKMEATRRFTLAEEIFDQIASVRQ
ncbi:hypothetical protein ACXIUS_29375 [Bosea thiooxidans]|nr:hypothetical protein [Bosea sp. (in: a-proteobacteria)]